LDELIGCDALIGRACGSLGCWSVLADALIVLSGDCRLRHQGTGEWCSQGMVCCGGGLGVWIGSCFHFGNSYEGLSVRIYGFLGDKGV